MKQESHGFSRVECQHPQFYSATLLSGALVKLGRAIGQYLDMPDLALVRLAGYRVVSSTLTLPLAL